MPHQKLASMNKIKEKGEAPLLFWTMKIIAGKYRSRTIKYAKSKTTRPTSNMVREGVFNMLGNIDDLIVLDLFAGSGAYGLESLSRGAKHVYFNDIDYKNTKIIKENLLSLNVINESTVHTLDYIKALNYYRDNQLYFDLIFIDPPYFENIYQNVISLILERLNHGGKIVIEINKDIPLEFNNNHFIILKDRNYGSKRIIILTHI